MKRTWICVLILAAATGMAMAQNSAAKVTVARWPQDRLAAISLTFDDGINTHLDIGGPTLKKHHLNGTFFVSTGRGPWEKRKPEWKHLAQEGNELGDHTVNHPCLLEQIKPHSQDYTQQMMEAEIRDAAQDITQLLSWQRGLTFAYPCGNMSFGKPEDEVKDAALYKRYVSEHAFGARTVGPGGPQDPDELKQANRSSHFEYSSKYNQKFAQRKDRRNHTSEEAGANEVPVATPHCQHVRASTFLERRFRLLRRALVVVCGIAARRLSFEMCGC